MFFKVMEFTEEVFARIQKRIDSKKYYKALNEIIAPLKTYAGNNLAIELGIFTEVIEKIELIIDELAESDTLDIDRLRELYGELKEFVVDQGNKKVNCTVNFLREIVMMKLMEIGNYSKFNEIDVVSSFKYFMTPTDLVGEIDQLSYEEWPYSNFYQEVFKPFLEKTIKLFGGTVLGDLNNYIIEFESEFYTRVENRYTQLIAENKSHFNEDRFAAALKLFSESKCALKQKEREHKALYEILKQQNFNFSSPFIFPFKDILLNKAASPEEREQMILMLARSIAGYDKQEALALSEEVSDSEEKLMFLMDYFKEEIYSLKYASLFLSVFSKDPSREVDLTKLHLERVVQYELERQNEKAVLAFIVAFFDERTRKPYLEEAMAIIFKKYAELISDISSLAKAIEMINFFETEYAQYTLLIEHQTFTTLMKNYNNVFFNAYNKKEAAVKIEKLISSLKNDILHNELYVSFAIYFQHISIPEFLDFLKKRVHLITNYTIEDKDNSYVYYSAFASRKVQNFLKEFNATNLDVLHLKRYFADGIKILKEIKESVKNDELDIAKNFMKDLRRQMPNNKQKKTEINYAQELMEAFNGLLKVIEKSGLLSEQTKPLRDWYNMIFPEQKRSTGTTKRRSSRRG